MVNMSARKCSEGENNGHERKKVMPWTEEEHQNFLAGLDNLGKGPWTRIAKEYVPTRTGTQVASHAQKYFQRMAAPENKKHRSSLFDTPLKELMDLQAPAPQVSHVSISEITAEIPPQASTSAQVVNPAPAHRLEAPPVLPMAAACGVSDFRGIPYMVGLPCNGVSFSAATMIPTVSFVPVMNFPGCGCVYLPKTHENFATCAPVTSHSPSSPSPQSLYHVSPPASPGTTSTEKDGLELRIGPPRTHENFATCAPVASHLPSISPESLYHVSPLASPGTTSTEKDGLELSIGPPRTHNGAKLLSQTSSGH